MTLIRRLSGLSDSWIAAAIIAGVVIFVYGDVAFAGYTLSPALPSYNVLVPPFGYHGRLLMWQIVVDPLATGSQNWPVYVLISKLIRSGQLPLWNPYQGTGAPLAVDETWSAYFPFDMLYVLVRNQYWDYLWFAKLWTASVLGYFLLRRVGLSFVSALGGGIAYCLSGAFIWYPFLTWTNVAILTPALLLVVIKCFDEPFGTGSIVFGSLAFALALLGAHLESILIQFGYVCLFAIFQVVTRDRQRKLGIATWAVTILLGIGLAAFFILPLQEYIAGAAFGHGPNYGIGSFASQGDPRIWWVGLFAPYVYSPLQTYLYPGLFRVFTYGWDASPGYVGICVLFLSLLALCAIIKKTTSVVHMKYCIFFLGSMLLVLMKLFGIFPINLIGLLPGFQYVEFTRYSGSVLAISFAGAGAYGLEFVRKGVSRNIVKWVLAFVLVTIFPAALMTIPNPLAPSASYFHVSVAYMGLSIYYAGIAAYFASRAGAHAAKGLVALLVLELVSYIPRSLTFQYEAARVCVLAGAGIALAVHVRLTPVIYANPHLGSEVSARMPTGSKDERPALSIVRTITSRNFIAILMVVALILQAVVSTASPYGIPDRYDPYTPAPYIKFLQGNLGNQRAYSLDSIFFAPTAGVYSMQNLGEFSSLMPSSFSDFARANLDDGAQPTVLLGNIGRIGSSDAATEVRLNLAFYSLLGVKYFVTSYNDIIAQEQTAAQPEAANDYEWITVGNNTVSASFSTDLPFDTLSLPITTYGRTSPGDLLIELDSVPFNVSLHREVRIDINSIVDGLPNPFSFAAVNPARETQFTLSLSQSDEPVGSAVAILSWGHVKPDPHLFFLPGSLNLALNLILRDPNLPLVYHDLNTTIYENLRVFPRAFLTERVDVALDEQDAIQKTRQLEWETHDVLVAEGVAEREISLVNSAAGVAGNASIDFFSSNYVSITTNVVRPSYLVLTDTWFPGWRAYVDGISVPIYRAYGDVRCVFLPEGPHKVLFKYEPISFEMGLIISIISGLALVALVCRPSIMNPNLRSRTKNMLTIRDPSE